MKKLNQFAPFNAQAFFAGKILMAMNSEDLVDFDSKSVIGAKYTVIIWEDNTDYGTEGISNAGETFTVKIEGASPKPVPKPLQIELIKPTGKIYGDYRNQLSVSADDIKTTGGN